MTFGSLFAGIGGFDLGLERAGMTCDWQVEIDGYARQTLARHWPDVRRWDDVRTFPPEPFGEWGVDLICGGFPCQDISNAGPRTGITGKRSGLWKQFERIIRVVRPRYILVENVPALLLGGRGMGVVLGDLAALGFDAEWRVLGADMLGATQHRKRLWILAYPHNSRCQGALWKGQPDPARPQWSAPCGEPLRPDHRPWPPGPRKVADIPRAADGAAGRVHRLRCLGNAVVPQAAEWIGRRIIESVND